MSIQMRDGTFSEIAPFTQELLDRFKEKAINGEAIALHAGELDELAKRIEEEIKQDEILESARALHKINNQLEKAGLMTYSKKK